MSPVMRSGDRSCERNSFASSFTIRYLAVYAKIADRWQMTAWQSTKVPDA